MPTLYKDARTASDFVFYDANESLAIKRWFQSIIDMPVLRVTTTGPAKTFRQDSLIRAQAQAALELFRTNAGEVPPPNHPVRSAMNVVGTQALSLYANARMLSMVEAIATLFEEVLDSINSTHYVWGIIAGIARSAPFADSVKMPTSTTPVKTGSYVANLVVAKPPVVVNGATSDTTAHRLRAPQDTAKQLINTQEQRDFPLEYPQETVPCEGGCPDGTVCENGICVPVADSGMDPCLDCLDDETCIDGVCVPAEDEGDSQPPPKKSKWPWLIGAIIVGGGVYLATRK